MAIGVPESEVFQAADRVLARGERPTVERVRAELGRGSPARIGQLLDQWWDRLAKRLAGETRLPDLPADAAAAFTSAWAAASEHATAAAEQSVAEAREGVEREKASLAAERQRWSADLESARAEALAAKDAQATVEMRLADQQRLVEQQQVELRDLRTQRDKLQEHADKLVQELTRLGAKFNQHEKDYAAERASTAAHVRSVEDRAHAEVDRARNEIKVLRAMHLQAERAGQEARAAAAREHKEHVAQLRASERDAAAQRARAEALEGQLQRLSVTLAAAERTRPRTQTKQGTAAQRRLLERLEKSTAHASAAIDDAVAYVEASNRKIAQGSTKKANMQTPEAHAHKDPEADAALHRPGKKPRGSRGKAN